MNRERARARASGENRREILRREINQPRALVSVRERERASRPGMSAIRAGTRVEHSTLLSPACLASFSSCDAFFPGHPWQAPLCRRRSLARSSANPFDRILRLLCCRYRAYLYMRSFAVCWLGFLFFICYGCFIESRALVLTLHVFIRIFGRLLMDSGIGSRVVNNVHIWADQISCR